MIDPIVLVVVVLIAGVLAFTLLQAGKKGDTRRNRGKNKSNPVERTRPCPLCGSPLKKGETVKTVIYPAKGDTLAEVFGCPYCYGDTAAAVRICPVCKKPIPEEGHVIGRMFKEGRHLHVLGCTSCRERR